MALSIIEMNYLQQGIVRPLENTLHDLVATQAMRHSQYVSDTIKTPEPENALALSFVSKSRNTISRLNNRDGGVFNSFLNTMILKLGNLTNFSDLRVYTITQWETFLSDNIAQTFEDVSGITSAERTAYNELP